MHKITEKYLKEGIKPCPFCGSKYEIYCGMAEDPASYWDSRIRGEKYSYIICGNCDLVMKGETIKQVIDKWNNRKEEQHGTT